MVMPPAFGKEERQDPSRWPSPFRGGHLFSHFGRAHAAIVQGTLVHAPDGFFPGPLHHLAPRGDVPAGRLEDRRRVLHGEGRTGGPLEEHLDGGVQQVVDLAGKINLRELSALLKKAKLFVGIDSGVMHMASALDVPTVAIFGPTDPSYTGPQNMRSRVVRRDLACSPCYLRKPCPHRECLEGLEAEVVMDACRDVLNS